MDKKIIGCKSEVRQEGDRTVIYVYHIREIGNVANSIVFAKSDTIPAMTVSLPFTEDKKIINNAARRAMQKVETIARVSQICYRN